ncbi:hypothetical protein POKO110462_23195 [Pontibacter korlensis]
MKNYYPVTQWSRNPCYAAGYGSTNSLGAINNYKNILLPRQHEMSPDTVSPDGSNLWLQKR